MGYKAMAKQSKTVFTKTLLDNTRRPEGIPTLVMTDSRLPGFQCLVGANTKTFSYVGYLNGRPIRCPIGRYPQLTVDEARAQAFALSQSFEKGVDPRHKPDMTLEDALEFTITKRMADEKISKETGDAYRALIKFTCKSWLRRDIKEITEEEVEELKHRLAKKGRKSSANYVIAILSLIRRTRKLPPFHITRYEIAPRKSKIDDWAAWYKAVMALSHQTRRNCLMFLALTGIRSDNGRSLRWKQVDLENKTIFLPKTKTTKDRTLPLSDAAVKVIEAQIGLDDIHVFPANAKAGYIVELRDPSVPGRVHDLRKMFTQAARRALLPDYAIAMLRCDSARTMRDVYDGEMPPHDWVEKVATELHRRWLAE